MVVSCHLIDTDLEVSRNNFSCLEKGPPKPSKTTPTDSFQRACECRDEKNEDFKSSVIDSLLIPFKFLYSVFCFAVNFVKELFDGVALLTPEGRISRFERDHNPDILNKYLPYRSSIASDPQKLEEYEKQVQLILNKSSIMHADKPACDENYCTDYNDLKASRPGECYLIAAYLVELYHNRFDLIEKVLNRNNGLKIKLVKEIKVKEMKHLHNGEEKEVHNSIGGFYDENENVMVLKTNKR